MYKRFVVCAVALIGLGGCGKGDPMQDASSSAPVAEAAAPEQPLAGKSLKGLLTSDPAILPGCNPQVVTVAWNISSLAPQLNDVEVYAGDALFASGGSTGSSATGPWTQPGSKFTLKSVPGGEVLDELVVGGPACPK